MRMRITDIPGLRSCDPSNLGLYLQARGWDPQEAAGGTNWIWRQDSEDAEAFVPNSTSMRGYAAFIEDTLSTLADVENRSELEIYREIMRVSIDTQYLEIGGSEDPGTASVNDVVISYESIRQWLLSAAVTLSADRRTLVQPTRKPSKALDFMRRVRVGPTYEGSYIITTQIPIPPQIGQQEFLFEEPQLAVISQPFERQVSLQLQSATESVARASREVLNRGRGIEAFKERLNSGVSANLCESIARMCGDSPTPFALRFSWASTRPVEAKPPIHFSPAEIQVVEEAARELRDEEPEEDVRITGSVTRLHREGSIGPGEVTIAGIIEGDVGERLRRVSLELPDEDYLAATAAHHEGHMVSVRGDIIRRGNRYALRHPTAFQALIDAEN